MKSLMPKIAVLLTFAALNISPLAAEESKTTRIVPGEEVTDRTGKKMRVWSTSGKVEVDHRARPQTGSNSVVDSTAVEVKTFWPNPQTEDNKELPLGCSPEAEEEDCE